MERKTTIGMKDQELIDLLKQQAKEIADANINGWGNTMLEAAYRLEKLVMPKPTHWLKLKLTEMLVQLESRVDRHYSGSWIVNDEALQEYKDGISYIKQLLSAQQRANNLFPEVQL